MFSNLHELTGYQVQSSHSGDALPFTPIVRTNSQAPIPQLGFPNGNYLIFITSSSFEDACFLPSRPSYYGFGLLGKTHQAVFHKFGYKLVANCFEVTIRIPPLNTSAHLMKRMNLVLNLRRSKRSISAQMQKSCEELTKGRPKHP